MFWSVETPDMLREKPRTSGMVLGLLIPPLIVCHQVKQYLRMKYVYKSMNFFDFLQPMENEKEV